MQIYKFGGASVHDEEGVKNVAGIVKDRADEGLVIVVSAMGKTTNALEKIHEQMLETGKIPGDLVAGITDFHFRIIDRLFPEGNDPLKQRLLEFSKPLEKIPKDTDPDAHYDLVVSVGELWSTAIVDAYLKNSGIDSRWLDARKLILTDNRHKEGRVKWEHTEERIRSAINAPGVFITQGFIAGGENGQTTTLGREGSDYSAAIIAYCLDANEVVIWKDVPGVLNADPKIFPDAVLRDEVSFHEAIELAYYGASVIHPRTIQPLKKKNIPLRVKSFVNPSIPGTLVARDAIDNTSIPSYITQKGQWLITIATRDLSFIVEEHLTTIFSAFARHKVKIDIMQNSAVNFSVSAHNKRPRMLRLIEELRKDFDVRYNDDLELLTIRHYNDHIIKRLTQGRNVLMEQRTRQTYRVLMA